MPVYAWILSTFPPYRISRTTHRQFFKKSIGIPDVWPISSREGVLLTYKQRRGSMEREKREKLEEREEQIVVLDEGIDMDDMAGPRAICCRGAMFAFRG